MAASAMALLAGCPVEAVIDSLRRFEGLEHRLEPVRELGGVTYINDSKGTNVGAVLEVSRKFLESGHPYSRRQGQGGRIFFAKGPG